MVYTFYKYQANGNDFILIDNRKKVFKKNNSKLINKICDRKLGIGADGLILLEEDSFLDFKMTYINSMALSQVFVEMVLGVLHIYQKF